MKKKHTSRNEDDDLLHSAALIKVNFARENSFEQTFGCPKAIVSSHGVKGWNYIHLAHRRLCAHTTPQHYSTQHVIAIQTEGTVFVERRLGGKLKRQNITVGDVYIVPSNTPHWTQTKGRQGLIFLSIEPHFLEKVAYEFSPSHSIELVPHFARADPFIYQLAVALKRTLQTGDEPSCFYIDSLGTALAAHLLEHYCIQSLTEEKITLDIKKAEAAVEYINANIAESLSLETIAGSVEMSQYHFCRMFKRVMGRSPWQYVIQQRIDIAKQLLKTTRLNISEIGRQIGFVGQSQFSNFFRRHVGVSPKAYRDNL